MNILLAVDQSRNSLAAAHWVQGLHLPAGSVVYLLDVVEIKQWCLVVKVLLDTFVIQMEISLGFGKVLNLFCYQKH